MVLLSIINRMYWTEVQYGHINMAPLTAAYPIITLVSGTHSVFKYYVYVSHDLHQCIFTLESEYNYA